MAIQIKEEPLDFNENNLSDLDEIDFISELSYIANNGSAKFIPQDTFSFSISDALNKMEMSKAQNSQLKKLPIPITKSTNQLTKPKSQRLEPQEALALEKKKILQSLSQIAKEKKIDPSLSASRYEFFNLDQEKRVLCKLKKHISDMENSNHNDKNRVCALRRFKVKLELRKLKREKHLKLFDLDSYVNELLDSEKLSQKEIKNENDVQQGFVNQIKDEVLYGDMGGEEDDVIFESETLATNLGDNENSECEIISVKRVLDRFKYSTRKQSNYDTHLKYGNIMFIGMVETRNDDVKCVLSPYSNM